MIEGTLLVAQSVEALCYKPVGRRFDSRWRRWEFFIDNPSGCTMALGSTQPLTEMSKRQSDPVTGPVWPRGWVDV